MNKIAILSTSSCLDIARNDQGHISSSNPSFLLKTLLAEEYEVIIITTREKLTSFDDCWRFLVKEENIYLPIGEYLMEGVRTIAIIRAWQKLFDRYTLLSNNWGSRVIQAQNRKHALLNKVYHKAENRLLQLWSDKKNYYWLIDVFAF